MLAVAVNVSSVDAGSGVATGAGGGATAFGAALRFAFFCGVRTMFALARTPPFFLLALRAAFFLPAFFAFLAGLRDTFFFTTLFVFLAPFLAAFRAAFFFPDFFFVAMSHLRVSPLRVGLEIHICFAAIAAFRYYTHG